MSNRLRALGSIALLFGIAACIGEGGWFRRPDVGKWPEWAYGDIADTNAIAEFLNANSNADADANSNAYANADADANFGP